jgi:tetratricopeptide (TPR) repeat protein
MRVAFTYASILDQAGHVDEAEAVYRERVATCEHELGAHAFTLWAGHALAGALIGWERYGEAEALVRDALQRHAPTVGDGDLDVALTRQALARTLDAQDRFDEADVEYDGAIAALRHVGDKPGTFLLPTMYAHATMLERCERFADAEAVHRRRVADAESSFGPRHIQTLAARCGVGRNLILQGRAGAAEAILREVEELSTASGEAPLAAPPWFPAVLRSWLGWALVDLGRYEEAEAYLVNAYPRIVETRGKDDENARRCLSNLVELFVATGQPEKATEYRALMQEAEEPNGADRASAPGRPPA